METVQSIPAAVADAANVVGEKVVATGHWVSLFIRERTFISDYFFVFLGRRKSS